jgi:hypothetical protein
VPDSIDTHGINHTFRADRSTCASCHGPGVTGEALTAQLELALEDIAAEAAGGVRDVLELRVLAGESYRVRAWDPLTDLYSSTSSSNSNVVLAEVPLAIAMTEIHGQAGFTMTMPNPVTITWSDGSQTTSDQVSTQIGSLKDMTAPTPVTLFAVDSDLVKSLWNYFLLHADGSGGVHNPEFTFDVAYETQLRLQLWRASLAP